MSFIAVGGTLLAGGAVGAGTIAVGGGLAQTALSIYGSTQANKAAQANVAAQQALVANLKYEPINIDKLRADATAAAVDNATKSLALERSLTPDVAAYRTTTDQAHAAAAKQVSAELALGGKLNTDTINQVTTAGRTIGAKSGLGDGNSAPLTASLLGLNSMALADKRRANALALTGPGAPPTAGLDPGAVASAEVAQNASMNEFNLAKMGKDSNLATSEAAARAAQIGGQTGIASSLAGLAGSYYKNKKVDPGYGIGMENIG